VARGLQAGLTPQKPQKSIALLGESAQALPRPARVFARNHADVTRERLAIAKSRRIPHEYVRRQRRDRADARMRHESARLRAFLGEGAHTLIEIMDVLGYFLVEHLQRRPPIPRVWQER
jgi:hypothetical protein